MVKAGNDRIIATITPRTQVELSAIREWKDWKTTAVVNEAIHALFEKIDKERS